MTPFTHSHTLLVQRCEIDSIENQPLCQRLWIAFTDLCVEVVRLRIFGSLKQDSLDALHTMLSFMAGRTGFMFVRGTGLGWSWLRTTALAGWLECPECSQGKIGLDYS